MPRSPRVCAETEPICATRNDLKLHPQSNDFRGVDLSALSGLYTWEHGRVGYLELFSNGSVASTDLCATHDCSIAPFENQGHQVVSDGDAIDILLTRFGRQVIAKVTYKAKFASFEGYRQSSIEMQPCNFSNSNQMFKCLGRCSYANDRFKLVQDGLCVGMFAHGGIGLMDCVAETELRFRELSYSHPSGVAQIEFAQYPGACLFVRSGLRTVLAVDFTCSQWFGARFLREGTLVNSNTDSFNVEMISDVLYNTQSSTRASTQSECLVLQSKLAAANVFDSLLLHIKDILAVPYVQQLTIDTEPFELGMQQAVVPMVGCSVQYFNTNRIKVWYASSAEQVHPNGNFADAHRRAAVSWNRNVQYGTVSKDGAQPQKLVIGVTVSSNRSISVHSVTGLPSEANSYLPDGRSSHHFKPRFKVSNFATEFVDGVFEANLGFSKQTENVSSDISRTPANGVTVGRNWYLYQADHPLRIRTQPTDTMWRPMQDVALVNTDTEFFSETLSWCKRSCELTSGCQLVSFSTNGHCRHSSYTILSLIANTSDNIELTFGVDKGASLLEAGGHLLSTSLAGFDRNGFQLLSLQSMVVELVPYVFSHDSKLVLTTCAEHPACETGVRVQFAACSVMLPMASPVQSLDCTMEHGSHVIAY